MRLSRWATSLYLQLQKLDFKSKPVARMIDRLNTRWLRMSEKVAAGALAYAKHHQAARIFCGHTHQALHVEQNGTDYFNSGGWVDSKLTYLTVDERGYRSMNTTRVSERADDRDSGEERSEADSALADFADESGLFEDAEYEGVGR